MKFEKDFDFESANAQFNKEEIDREFHNKLKLKGKLHVKRKMIFCLSSFISNTHLYLSSSPKVAKLGVVFTYLHMVSNSATLG